MNDSQNSEVQDLVLNPPDQMMITGKSEDTVEAFLKLSNKSGAKRIAYKLKPSHPTLIRLKPVVGILNPNETVEISVKRLPFQPDDYSGNCCKLLVMSNYVSASVKEAKVYWASTSTEPTMQRLVIKFTVP